MAEIEHTNPAFANLSDYILLYLYDALVMASLFGSIFCLLKMRGLACDALKPDIVDEVVEECLV